MPRPKRTSTSGFHTNIDKRILKNFKKTCTDIGVPMRVVVEAFMYQFAEGQFRVKVGKNDIEVETEV